MFIKKDFITELFISGIDLLHTNIEYLIQNILELFKCNMHSRLSTERCFQIENMQNAPVCRGTVLSY